MSDSYAKPENNPRHSWRRKIACNANAIRNPRLAHSDAIEDAPRRRPSIARERNGSVSVVDRGS